MTSTNNYYRFRVDTEIKQRFQNYCKEQNLNASEVVRQFLDAVSSQQPELIAVEEILDNAKHG